MAPPEELDSGGAAFVDADEHRKSETLPLPWPQEASMYRRRRRAETPTDLIRTLWNAHSPSPHELRRMTAQERADVERELKRVIVKETGQSRQLVDAAVERAKRGPIRRGPKEVRAKCPLCGGRVDGLVVDRDKPPSPELVRQHLEQRKAAS